MITSPEIDLNCEICLNPFGSGNQCPRILLCGHSYCQSCVSIFIKGGSPCPTCKGEVKFQKADEAPINYFIKIHCDKRRKSDSYTRSSDTSEEIQNSSSGENTDRSLKLSERDLLPYEGYCKEHILPNHFKCMDCSSYICGTCAVLLHKNDHEILSVNEAMVKIKSNKLKNIVIAKDKITRELKTVDKEVVKLSDKQRDLNILIDKATAEIQEIDEEINSRIAYKEEKNSFIEELTELEAVLKESHYQKQIDEATKALDNFCIENQVYLATLFEPVSLSKQDSFDSVSSLIILLLM